MDGVCGGQAFFYLVVICVSSLQSTFCKVIKVTRDFFMPMRIAYIPDLHQWQWLFAEVFVRTLIFRAWQSMGFKRTLWGHDFWCLKKPIFAKLLKCPYVFIISPLAMRNFASKLFSVESLKVFSFLQKCILILLQKFEIEFSEHAFAQWIESIRFFLLKLLMANHAFSRNLFHGKGVKKFYTLVA